MSSQKHTGYMSSAISGFSSQTVIKVVGNGLALAKMVILARWLTPVDFGVFSLVAIALGLSESLTQTGVNVTLVQSKQSVEYFLDTAWVIAICRGFIIGLIMVLMGWGMSGFFGQTDLLYLVSLAAFIPVIKGFINPAIISLYKSLNFVGDGFYRLSLITIETVLTIGLVIMVPTVGSWIWALLLAAAVEVLISFLFFKARPVFSYLPNRASIIFNNAKWLNLSSILSYLNDNLDNVLIGKIIGAYGLGLYQNTYAVTHELTYEVGKSIHHGTLPIYTKITDDPSRLRRAFGRTFLIGLLGVTATSIPLFLFPDFLITLVFGPQWAPAIPLVRWLLLAGWLHALMMMGYTLLIARRDFTWLNLHTGVTVVLLVAAIWWGGSQFGLLGAVQGVVVSRLVSLPILIWAVWRNVYAHHKS